MKTEGLVGEELLAHCERSGRDGKARMCVSLMTRGVMSCFHTQQQHRGAAIPVEFSSVS